MRKTFVDPHQDPVANTAVQTAQEYQDELPLRKDSAWTEHSSWNDSALTINEIQFTVDSWGDGNNVLLKSVVYETGESSNGRMKSKDLVGLR